MRIYELLNQSTQQQLDPGRKPNPNQEDDQDGKFDADKVDGSLQDIAQNVQDQDAQPDLPSGAEQNPPELDDNNVQPLDSALMGQIQNLPYVSRYKYDEKSPMNPMNIAAMSVADLNGMMNMVRVKIQATTMRDQVGVDDDTDMQFYTDLRKFINTVLKFKKTSTKAQRAAQNPTPPYQRRR
jgi:hypothetical protein